MTIVKQISLFDIHQLLEMESSHRYDAIFSVIDIQPIFQLFSKKTLKGAPRELNYGAMIQSLIIRIVERIPTIKDLVKRLVHDPLFRFDCGFLVSDVVPSESSYSRMIQVISVICQHLFRHIFSERYNLNPMNLFVIVNDKIKMYN